MSIAPKQEWLVLIPGCVLFWDGLIHMNQDVWDGLVLTLMDLDGTPVREVTSGPFNILAPYNIHLNGRYLYPLSVMGSLN